MAQTRRTANPNSSESAALAEVIKANEEIVSNPRLSKISESWEKLKLADQILSNFEGSKDPVKAAIMALKQSQKTRLLLKEAGLNPEDPKQSESLLKDFAAQRQSEGRYNLMPSIILNDAEGNTFEIGKAELKPEFKSKIINDVIPELIQKVAKYKLDVIEVIGHTDDIPIRSLKSNLDEDSQARTQGGDSNW